MNTTKEQESLEVYKVQSKLQATKVHYRYILAISILAALMGGFIGGWFVSGQVINDAQSKAVNSIELSVKQGQQKPSLLSKKLRRYQVRLWLQSVSARTIYSLHRTIQRKKRSSLSTLRRAPTAQKQLTQVRVPVDQVRRFHVVSCRAHYKTINVRMPGSPIMPLGVMEAGLMPKLFGK